MPNYAPRGRVLYSSVTAGLGDTINANGNTGTPLIDLQDALDVVLSVNVGVPTGTTPTLVMGLDLQDANGNWIVQALKTANITSAGLSVVHGGLHIGGAAAIVLTQRGRISWTITGASATFPGVQISLIGR